MSIMRIYLDTLVDAGYLIELESGALLISDWLIHNKIRQDRYVEGQHSTELNIVQILPTGRYAKAL